MTNKPADIGHPATLRVPICILAAGVTALVAFTLAFIAAANGMTIQAVVVMASVATVAGCSVLAAAVVVCCRKACKDLQRIIACKIDKKMKGMGENLDAVAKSLRGEMLEQHRQTRIAHYTLTGEMTSGESDAKPRLHTVKN